MFKDKIIFNYLTEKCIDIKVKASQFEINIVDSLKEIEENLYPVIIFFKLSISWMLKISLFLLKSFAFLIYSGFCYLLTWIPSKNINRYFAHFFCRWILNFLKVDVTIINRSKMEYDKVPCVIISNHPSEIEGFVFPLIFKNFHALINRTALFNNFLYRTFSAYGHVIMDKSNYDTRQEALLKMKNLIQAGNNVAICPEGKCSLRIADRFYKGAFGLGISQQVPIIPLYCYFDDADFLLELEKVSPKLIARLISSKRHKLTIYIHEAIYLPTNMDPVLAAEEVRKQYLNWQSEIQRSV